RARPILRPASVRVHFPTDRRGRPAHRSSDRPQRQPRGYTPRDLLTLRQRQPQRTTLPGTPTPPTGIRDELPQRRVLSTQLLGDALDRHTRLAQVPDRLLVLLREPNHPNTSRSTAPNARHQDLRCVDQLRTHWIGGTARFLAVSPNLSPVEPN